LVSLPIESRELSAVRRFLCSSSSFLVSAVSSAFADFVESDFDLEPVGEYPVRGFSDPIELFAYHG
jgi:hypothetical protein